MSLYRMQDLGGCRVIVNSIDQVYEAVEKYKTSRIRHILKREYDYIQNPKNLDIVHIIWFTSFIATEKKHIIRTCL